MRQTTLRITCQTTCQGISAVEGLVPGGEAAEAFAEGGGGLEAEVALEGGGVGVGDGYVAGLHGHEAFVGLEVVVGGKYTGGEKLFLKNLHEVKKVLGRVVADVVDGIGGLGKTVLASLALGSLGHDAHHALDDVVDVCEVALAVSVVEDLDRVAFEELVGEAEVCHVGTAGGTVDGEETQAGGGYVVELAVGVRHKLVALLGGGVEGDGIVYLVIGGVRHFLI